MGVQYALRRMAASHPDPELRAFMGDVVVGLCAVTANVDGGESRQLIVDPGLFRVEQINAARRAGRDDASRAAPSGEDRAACGGRH